MLDEVRAVLPRNSNLFEMLSKMVENSYPILKLYAEPSAKNAKSD